jgi:hypothetical protein
MTSITLKKVVPLTLTAAALFLGYGCSSTAAPAPASKGKQGTTPVTPNTTKPSPGARAHNAKPPAARPKKPSGKPVSTPPKPVDPKPVDDSTQGPGADDFFPTFGADLGVSCADEGLSEGAGSCYTDSTGDQYVIACDGGKVWALGCSVFEPDENTASSCVANGPSVACELTTLAPVAPIELDDIASGADLGPCPERFDGKGSCVGDGNQSYVVMCKGGKAAALDCADYNSDGFTYACGTTDGVVACESQ